MFGSINNLTLCTLFVELYFLNRTKVVHVFIHVHPLIIGYCLTSNGAVNC